MARFEYKTDKLGGYEYEKVKQLNWYGERGWELVRREGDYCTFKRKID